MKKYIIQSFKLTGIFLAAHLLNVVLAFAYGMFILRGPIADEITAEAVMAVISNVCLMIILYIFMYEKGFKSNEHSNVKLNDLRMFLLPLIMPTLLLFLMFMFMIPSWGTMTSWFLILANPSGNVGLIRDELIDYVSENHFWMLIISAFIHTFLQIALIILGYIRGYKKRGKKRSKLA